MSFIQSKHWSEVGVIELAGLSRQQWLHNPDCTTWGASKHSESTTKRETDAVANRLPGNQLPLYVLEVG
jgi:hypothetical protein